MNGEETLDDATDATTRRARDDAETRRAIPGGTGGCPPPGSFTIPAARIRAKSGFILRDRRRVRGMAAPRVVLSPLARKKSRSRRCRQTNLITRRVAATDAMRAAARTMARRPLASAAAFVFGAIAGAVFARRRERARRRAADGDDGDDGVRVGLEVARDDGWRVFRCVLYTGPHTTAFAW